MGAPWQVESLNLQRAESKFTVTLIHEAVSRFGCPECGQESPVYDLCHRRWRHLDTCRFITMIEADVPRVALRIKYGIGGWYAYGNIA